jgi:LysR family transcriptional regulator, regulator for bpeEF and oprC
MIDRVRTVEIFLRAVEAGSFAKAAALLSLTPSSVSRAIADLEHALGVPLFHRTTRHLKLTDEGEEVYRRGREIREKLSELESALARPGARLAGTLRVGLSPNLNRYVVTPGVPAFLRRHPGLKLQCSVITEPGEMHSEGMDVLLRVTEPPESALVARKLGALRFGVYASPDYLAAAGTPTMPEDLLAHRCVVHHPRVLRRPLDEWAFERAQERRVIQVSSVFSTNDREALIAAVIGGAGIMRIGMFDPALVTSGVLRKVLPEWTCPGGQPVYALYRKTARLAPKVAAFLEFVEEAFAAFDRDELTVVHVRNDRRRRPAP